jgi:hypothetical protein
MGSIMARPEDRAISKETRLQRFSAIRILSLNPQRRFQGKRNGRLSRQHDLLVAGEGSSSASCSGSSCCANRSSLATTRQSPDQRTQTGASAHHRPSALAFAFQSLREGCGFYRQLTALNCDGIQLQLEERTSRKASERFRVYNYALNSCTSWNRDLAVYLYWLRETAPKALPGLADF